MATQALVPLPSFPSPLYFIIISTRSYQHSLIKSDYLANYEYLGLKAGIRLRDVYSTVEGANKAAERVLVETYNSVPEYYESCNLLDAWKDDAYQTVTFAEDGCLKMKRFPRERSCNELRYPVKVNVKKVEITAFPFLLRSMISRLVLNRDLFFSPDRFRRFSKVNKQLLLGYVTSYLKQAGNSGVSELGCIPLPKLSPSTLDSHAPLTVYPVFVNPTTPANFLDPPRQTVPIQDKTIVLSRKGTIQRKTSLYNLAIKEWLPGKQKGDEVLDKPGDEPDAVTHMYFLGYDNALQAFYKIVKAMGFDFPAGDYGAWEYYNTPVFTPRYYQQRKNPDECEFWVRINEVALSVTIGDEEWMGGGVETDRGLLFVSDWDGSVRGWNQIFPGPGRIEVPFDC